MRRGAAAGLGLLSLASIDSGDAQAAPVDCTAPISASTCRIAEYRQCAGKAKPCTSLLQSGFEQAHSGAVDRERYQDLDDTKAIIPGRIFGRSIPPSAVTALGGFTSYQGLESRAQALAQSNVVTPSSSYTRNGQWTGNGAAVHSCAEYVYEKYYDYMRFVDAANSCKQDENCVVDMAFAKTPLGALSPSNIADRQLTGRSAAPVPLPPLPLTSGVVPKNRFYVGAVLLSPRVRAALEGAFPTWKTTLDSAVARAFGGANYYRWGTTESTEPPVVRQFQNEFTFHKAMRAATANVSVAESKANLRRMERFEELFASFSLEAFCHGLTGAENLDKCHGLPELRQSGLLEFLGGDPWVRSRILSSDTLRQQAFDIGLQGGVAMLDVAGGSVLAVDSVGVGGLGGLGGLGSPISYVSGPSGPTSTTSSGSTSIILVGETDPEVDPSPLWTSGMGRDLENEWYSQPLTPDTQSATPRFDCAVEANVSSYRLLACQAINAVLDEVSRDNASCFDTNYAGCDWAPSMFAQRFHRTQMYMRSRVRDYNECVRWTANLFTAVPTDSKANFQELEELIGIRRKAYEDFDAPFTKKSNGRVDHFGETKTESVEMGDKGSFGGGYAYLAGWDSRPTAHSPTPVNAPPVCRLDFTADASFQAWGSAFDIQKDFFAAEAHLRANEDDNGTATMTRELSVVGEQLIAEKNVVINHASGLPFSPGLAMAGVEAGYEFFNSTYPLPYGFYVTIQAGVEVAAGAIFYSTAEVPAKQTCAGLGQPMKADARVIPYARASLYGSASGGWGGIVEAGLEATLDLVKAQLRVMAQGEVTSEQSPKVKFDLDGKLTMKTLSGTVDACGCFVGFCGCTEVASWPGVDLGTTNIFRPVHASAELLIF